MLHDVSESPSFVRLNDIPLSVQTAFLFMHSSIVHLGCFYCLVRVNNAAMNMRTQISLRDPAFDYFG